MKIRIPSKRICERFRILHELRGCQTAVDFLSRYYGIRRMKVVLDGRGAGRGNRGCYFENKARAIPKWTVGTRSREETVALLTVGKEFPTREDSSAHVL